MRTPNIGDEYVSTRNSDKTLGKALTWRVTKVAKKADGDYVELEAINSNLPNKFLCAGALRDTRLFSRAPS